MARDRFRETGKGSFFGDLVYDRVVPQDHFLRKLNEVVDWRPFTKKLVQYYKGGAAALRARPAPEDALGELSLRPLGAADRRPSDLPPAG